MSNTEPDTKCILEAGRAAATADQRRFDIELTVRGVKTLAPFTIDNQGQARFLKDALDYADQRAAKEAPERHGTYGFGDMASLLAWAATFKTENTAAFVTAPGGGTSDGRVNVVIDELPVDKERGASRRLSGSLRFGLSPELAVWVRTSGNWLTAEQFHSFVDEHIDEMADASVLTMAANIEIRAESSWKRVVSDNGKVALVDESKAGPTTAVPRRFTFLAPVFSIDDPANLKKFECALRLKLDGKKPLFQFEIIGLHRSLAEATQLIVQQVSKTCTTYLGGQ